jgi:cytochrome c-type biogenesis protein CcmF
LLNNILLVVMLLIVLLGTLYPLIADALNLGKISVGPPYFNLFFIPFLGLVLILMPLGARLKWKEDSFRKKSGTFAEWTLWCLAGGTGFSYLYEGTFNLKTVVVIGLVLWAVLLTLQDLLQQTRNAETLKKGFSRLSRSYKGMVLAHLGFILTATGVCLSSLYSESKDVRMEVNVPVTMAGMEYIFHGAHLVKGENYVAHAATVTVRRGQRLLADLHTEKRLYNSDRGNRMTEAGIDPGLWADLYVSMGEPIDKDQPQGAWAMRLHYKPFVRWIWSGALLMALGALLASNDRRYRKIQLDTEAHEPA